MFFWWGLFFFLSFNFYCSLDLPPLVLPSVPPPSPPIVARGAFTLNCTKEFTAPSAPSASTSSTQAIAGSSVSSQQNWKKGRIHHYHGRKPKYNSSVGGSKQRAKVWVKNRVFNGYQGSKHSKPSF